VRERLPAGEQRSFVLSAQSIYSAARKNVRERFAQDPLVTAVPMLDPGVKANEQVEDSGQRRAGFLQSVEDRHVTGDLLVAATGSSGAG
jgi:hypothetical protein